ncbi:MAG: hypothetical protein U0R64_01535 [Candidatus Nanopelagicales bacterium]
MSRKSWGFTLELIVSMLTGSPFGTVAQFVPFTWKANTSLKRLTHSRYSSEPNV